MALDGESELTDEALLILYGQGDRAAARALTLRLGPFAYRVALRMLRDPAEAEDVAQEALMRLWRIAAQWRAGEAQVSTWLYRVTANLSTDRLRKRRMVGLDAAPDVPDLQPSAHERMVEAARGRALWSALERLPDRQREAVVLRHIEGLSNPQIAQAMETGVEAVESLTARGKRALVALLRGQRDALGYGDE